jgi:hypothetical protein
MPQLAFLPIAFCALYTNKKKKTRLAENQASLQLLRDHIPNLRTLCVPTRLASSLQAINGEFEWQQWQGDNIKRVEEF